MLCHCDKSQNTGKKYVFFLNYSQFYENIILSTENHLQYSIHLSLTWEYFKIIKCMGNHGKFQVTVEKALILCFTKLCDYIVVLWMTNNQNINANCLIISKWSSNQQKIYRLSRLNSIFFYKLLLIRFFTICTDAFSTTIQRSHINVSFCRCQNCVNQS